MNNKYRNLLHYLLIMLMMLSPVRNVMAAYAVHCDMDEMAVSTTLNSSASASESRKITHASHDMSTMTDMNHSQSTAAHQLHQQSTDQVETAHQCCCCDSTDGCSGNCEMGMTASLILHDTNYAPVLMNVARSTGFSSAVLIRELTPPSRPPAYLPS